MGICVCGVGYASSRGRLGRDLNLEVEYRNELEEMNE